MLLIHCPHCREDREEEEFSYGGEAHIVRPLEPEALSDQEWGDYLFFRNNPEVSTMRCGITLWVVDAILMPPAIP